MTTFPETPLIFFQFRLQGLQLISALCLWWCWQLWLWEWWCYTWTRASRLCWARRRLRGRGPGRPGPGALELAFPRGGNYKCQQKYIKIILNKFLSRLNRSLVARTERVWLTIHIALSLRFFMISLESFILPGRRGGRGGVLGAARCKRHISTFFSDFFLFFKEQHCNTMQCVYFSLIAAFTCYGDCLARAPANVWSPCYLPETAQ